MRGLCRLNACYTSLIQDKGLLPHATISVNVDGNQAPARPRDPIALAKLIGDIATGQIVDAVEDGKDAVAANTGRKGGCPRA